MNVVRGPIIFPHGFVRRVSGLTVIGNSSQRLPPDYLRRIIRAALAKLEGK